MFLCRTAEFTERETANTQDYVKRASQQRKSLFRASVQWLVRHCVIFKTMFTKKQLKIEISSLLRDASIDSEYGSGDRFPLLIDWDALERKIMQLIDEFAPDKKELAD